MIVQIYAATSVQSALSMVNFGVDQIGFVVGLYGEVHAELSFDEAQDIVEALRGRAVSSALTMSTDPDEILRMARSVRPDLVHISSDTAAVDVAAMRQIKRDLPASTRLMKAIHVSGPESLDTAGRFAAVADVLLLDTKVPGLPGVGATGQTHDWQISRRIIETIAEEAQVILAGGLTPQNVAQAIQATRPWGVDSNTGTNIAGDPVQKDMALVEAFVKRAKAC
jgi:phosphoribosylanthranilate isomerase